MTLLESGETQIAEAASAHDQRDDGRALVRKVAEECIDEADGDWPAAAQRFRRRLADDRRLYDELVAPLIDAAIWSAIRGAAHRQRREAMEPPRQSPAGLEAMAETNARRLLDYPLTGGIRLRDATREVLLEQAEQRLTLARGNAVASKWLEKIAADLKPDELVSDRFDDERLERLLAATKAEISW